jgi:hypothetical protein
MIAERSGTIRIFNIESLKPVFSLPCLTKDDKEISYPAIFSFDWCQFSPEIIIANTTSDIYIWNTAKSRYDIYLSNINFFLSTKNFF